MGIRIIAVACRAQREGPGFAGIRRREHERDFRSSSGGAAVRKATSCISISYFARKFKQELYETYGRFALVPMSSSFRVFAGKLNAGKWWHTHTEEKIT